MSKGTPGPWWLHASYSTIYVEANSSDPQLAQEVAAVGPKEGGRYQQEADARLIATAPEMLSALIAAVECGMVPISSAKEGGAVTHSIQVRVADQIRAAIAKATGETE